MRTIQVHHRTGPDQFTHVADVVHETGMGSLSESLEFAWRWTQNIEASWSRGPTVVGSDGKTYPNPDHHPHLTVLASLPVHDGQVYGLRSSMIGDRFIVDGVTYVAASFGFEKLEG